jgi:hypothetical protein
MNQETNSGAQDTQQERAAPHKRNSRAGRNRPVLVSPTSSDQVTQEQPVEETTGTAQPVEEAATPTTKVEDARPRRLPKFFSRVGKDEKEQAPEADPTTARIARATRSTGGTSASSHTIKESKTTESESSTDKASSNKTNAKVAPASAPRRQGGMKMRYILGMLLYLVVAEVAGGYERTLLITNHLDRPLIQLGPISVTTSTALFLVTLIVLLVVLARFDLLPRSLGALSGQPTPQRGQSGRSSSGSDTDKGPPPTMKQGVKGADDDLYQEYREQQRYLQRRERKK